MPELPSKASTLSPASIGYALTRYLPRRALTLVAGRACALPVPVALRQPLYGGYCALTGARASEAAQPLRSYGSLDAFFTRELGAGLRSWSSEADVVASPADGRVAQCGDGLTQGAMVQAKGLTYQLDALLGGPATAFDGGAWATVYLSPADYHRVHPPCAMDVERVRWLGRELWPVNGLSVPFVEDLFVVNERVALIGRGRDERGVYPAALVMVAATVVGGIELYHEGLPFRRAHDGDRHEIALERPWAVSPEEAVGAFHLGSTAIVVVGRRSDGATPRVAQSFRFTASSVSPRIKVGTPMIRFQLT